jgi:hypothetical protein
MAAPDDPPAAAAAEIADDWLTAQHLNSRQLDCTKENIFLVRSEPAKRWL